MLAVAASGTWPQGWVWGEFSLLNGPSTPIMRLHLVYTYHLGVSRHLCSAHLDGNGVVGPPLYCGIVSHNSHQAAMHRSNPGHDAARWHVLRTCRAQQGKVSTGRHSTARAQQRHSRGAAQVRVPCSKLTRKVPLANPCPPYCIATSRLQALHAPSTHHTASYPPAGAAPRKVPLTNPCPPYSHPPLQPTVQPLARQL